jgi:hypothetical protein
MKTLQVPAEMGEEPFSCLAFQSLLRAGLRRQAVTEEQDKYQEGGVLVDQSYSGHLRFQLAIIA